MPRKRQRSLRLQIQRAFLVMLVPLVVVTAVGVLLLQTGGQQLAWTTQQVKRGAKITDVLTRLAESGRTLSELVLHQTREPIVTYLALAPSLDRDFDTVVKESPPEAMAAAVVAIDAWRTLWRALRGVEERTRSEIQVNDTVLHLIAVVAENAVISSQHLDQVASANAAGLQRSFKRGYDRQRLQELLLLLSATLGLVVGVVAAQRLHRRVRRQLDDLSAAAADSGRGPTRHRCRSARRPNCARLPRPSTRCCRESVKAGLSSPPANGGSGPWYRTPPTWSSSWTRTRSCATCRRRRFRWWAWTRRPVSAGPCPSCWTRKTRRS